MRKNFNLFNNICSAQNLFSAWDEFKVGKGKKLDVLEFEKRLEQNIFKLHRDLCNQTYQHGPYEGFYISDPKRRHIHKATVRDRILHHAVFRELNPVFEPAFISNSFSCRIGKGTHKGVEALATMLIKESYNNRRNCYALKCDIRKFFDSIDHQILFEILKKKIKDKKALFLLDKIIQSYATNLDFARERERERELSCSTQKGIPIGNLTSQLFANVYMNEFDQFVKHTLKVKYYARYTDDFIIVSNCYQYLNDLLKPIQSFLENNLKLNLHPKKMEIRKYSQGIDFLGYIILPHFQLIRKRTWKRMLRKFRISVKSFKLGNISDERLYQSLGSSLGALSHANSHKLEEQLKNQILFE